MTCLCCFSSPKCLHANSVEAAGGKALPCVVDVRDEKQISEAVENAVQKFGGKEMNAGL